MHKREKKDIMCEAKFVNLAVTQQGWSLEHALRQYDLWVHQGVRDVRISDATLCLLEQINYPITF